MYLIEHVFYDNGKEVSKLPVLIDNNTVWCDMTCAIDLPDNVEILHGDDLPIAPTPRSRQSNSNRKKKAVNENTKRNSNIQKKKKETSETEKSSQLKIESVETIQKDKMSLEEETKRKKNWYEECQR